LAKKIKILAKIKYLAKNKNRNFGQKSKVWPKIESLAKNRKLSGKSKFWPKIKIWAKNRNFSQKSKFWPKITTAFTTAACS